MLKTIILNNYNRINILKNTTNSLIPVEVKASNHATPSLRKLVEQEKYSDIKYGIKLCAQNIGYNGKFYTFPYFTTFLLKRFLREHRLEALVK